MPNPKKQAPHRFFTVAEVAAILALSRPTVYRMVDKGELPGVKFGGAVRISRAALDGYISRQLALATAEDDAPPPRATDGKQTRPVQGKRGRRARGVSGFECLPRD